MRVNSLQKIFRMQPIRHTALVASMIGVIASVPHTVNAQSNTPVCSSAASDSDGDGWGWENSRSCIVDSSIPANSSSPANSSTPVISATPVNTSAAASTSGFPACSSSQFDSDGDGYGWENDRTWALHPLTIHRTVPHQVPYPTTTPEAARTTAGCRCVRVPALIRMAMATAGRIAAAVWYLPIQIQTTLLPPATGTTRTFLHHPSPLPSPATAMVDRFA